MSRAAADAGLDVAREGAVLRLTLNRPDDANRLTPELVTALRRQLDAAADDDALRVLVIAARGAAFCAGAARDACPRDTTALRAAAMARSDLVLALARCPQITIAAVGGDVGAAGLELVLACDLVLAARRVRFAAPGIADGRWEYSTQVALSRALPRRVALELLLTGAPLGAHAAQRLGLVNRVLAAERLPGAVDALARDLAAHPAGLLAEGKRAFDRQASMTPADAYDDASERYHQALLDAAGTAGDDEP